MSSRIYNYNRRKKSISSLSLLPSSSLSKSHSHSEKKENMYVSPSQIGKPLFSAIIVIIHLLLSPRVSTPSRCIDAIFFIGGENTRREKVFLLLLSPHHVVEGGRGRRTGWNGLNNVNYPAKRVGGPCIYPCRVAPAKIEENRGPSERGGWGGEEKERGRGEREIRWPS